MATALVLLVADTPVDPTTGKGPEWGKAAPIALLIILLMGLALFVLIRSMNRQLKKVPSDFMRGTPAAPTAGTAPAPTDGAPAAPTTPVDVTTSPPGDGDPTTRS